MLVVMGLPGAGKSTVLKVAEERGWKVLNYGTLMMEIAEKEFSIKDRDELRKQSADVQKKIQARVGQKLSEIKERQVVLDTHCSVNTPKGYLPGLPYSLLKDLNVERFVLITAPIEDVLRRRQKDASRIRDAQSPESLKEHDDMNKAMLASYAILGGAPATILINADGKIENVKEKFSQYLE
jgi:adenylate kinase